MDKRIIIAAVTIVIILLIIAWMYFKDTSVSKFVSSNVSKLQRIIEKQKNNLNL